MAKPLRTTVPTSSVARLFDVAAAAEAVATPSAPPPMESHTPPPVSVEPRQRPRTNHVEQPTVKRELVLTPSTHDTLENLVDVLRRTTRSRLTTSHVARALLKAVEHCLPQITREARKLGALKLPSNARAWEKDRERFEAQLADAILSGLREGGPQE